MRQEKLKPALEAALFMSNDPMKLEGLAKIVDRKPEEIKPVIDQLKEELEKSDRGMHILETSAGYQMRVKPEFSNMVRNLTPYQDLSKGLLRVLALVAYKQPITQSEIVKVIGNRAYEYVKKLEEKGLIKTIKQSRTKALIATKEFANYFGLESPEEIKKFFDEQMKQK